MSHENTTTTEHVADELVHDLFALGRSWAAYGLTVGRLAVQQSARSLERGAKVLDGAAVLLQGLKTEFEPEEQPEEQPEEH